MKKSKLEARTRKKLAVRKRVNGTAERPRLSVFRSLNHLYVQVIDDVRHVTVAQASTMDAEAKGGEAEKKVDQAKRVGELVAKRCIEKGLTKVVFDRSGFIYHGRVAAVAQAARQAGLVF